MALPGRNHHDKDKQEPAQNDYMTWDEIMAPGKSTGLTTDEQLGNLPKKEKNSKIKAVVIGVVLLLVIAIAVWVPVQIAMNHRNEILEQNLNSVQEAPKRVESKVKPDTSSSYKNPAADSSDVGAPAAGTTEARVDGKKIILKSENRESSFLFPSVKDKITGVDKPCSLNKGAENCYLGEAKASNGKTIRFWAFRDAKSSALLSETTDANIVAPGGAALAYTTKMTDGDNKDKSCLYIVLKNQTGVLAVADDAVTLDAMVNGSDAFQVQQG